MLALGSAPSCCGVLWLETTDLLQDAACHYSPLTPRRILRLVERAVRLAVHPDVRRLPGAVPGIESKVELAVGICRDRLRPLDLDFAHKRAADESVILHRDGQVARKIDCRFSVLQHLLVVQQRDESRLLVKVHLIGQDPGDDDAAVVGCGADRN